MKPAELRALQSLLELRFQKKQMVFAKVLAEESTLRTHLKSLDERAREAEATAGPHIRAIGADIAWKGFVEKAKASKNRELAQVLAQKQSMLDAVRKEFGKVLVGQELARSSAKRVSEDGAKRQLSTAIEAHLQRIDARSSKKP